MEHQRLSGRLAEFDMTQEQLFLHILRRPTQCIKSGFAYGDNLLETRHSFQQFEFMLHSII